MCSCFLMELGVIETPSKLNFPFKLLYKLKPFFDSGQATGFCHSDFRDSVQCLAPSLPLSLSSCHYNQTNYHLHLCLLIARARAVSRCKKQLTLPLHIRSYRRLLTVLLGYTNHLLDLNDTHLTVETIDSPVLFFYPEVCLNSPRRTALSFFKKIFAKNLVNEFEKFLNLPQSPKRQIPFVL